MADLSNKTIAVIATDGFEDSELTSPVEAVKDAGATVKVLSTKGGTIEGKNGTKVDVDTTTGLACLLYTSPSPRDRTRSRMPSSA